jgi:hypothetical protein
MKKISMLFFLMSCFSVFGQTGVIRGTILDQQSELPLSGATIELVGSATPIGVVADLDGYFKLSDVPVGRQTIRVSYIGFEPAIVSNIIVNAGKDAIISVKLQETFAQLDEVVISANDNKNKTLNKMSTISARQFGLEEVSRFAGGRSDVGRLAANFAGVSAPDDSRNDIVVRGNSPVGLLWRLEGIPIPSPNHFSTIGTTGGPVSALNPNLLKNSDFITSAFAAEYGNAIGGVFDLGFRNGNTENYEYNAQIGVFTGLEAMAEGPLGKNRGSFLVSGRYSLVGLLGSGAGGTAAVPNYSDLSFNINFGSGKLGQLSVFGILGNSNIDFLGDDIDENDLFAAEDEDTFVDSNFGVVGLKHQIRIGKNSYLRTILAGATSANEFTADRYIDKNTANERTILFTEANNTENRYSFSTLFNSKISNKTTLRTGILIENFQVESLLRDRLKQPDLDGDGDPDLFTFRDIDEELSIIQPFVQSQLRLSEKIVLNTGLHAQYSTLNEQLVVEPRLGLSYTLNKKHALNIGYGIHHQPIPLPILFLNENVNGELQQTNKDLDFVRSTHYVLGYDFNFAKNWRAKAEIYRQDITNAAVEPFESSYSSLTEGADFDFENDRVSLVSEGTGFNQGIELTVEKFFSDGFYGLLTTTFYESKYKGSDGIERNTPFNNGYVINFLAGKEFPIGKSKRNNLFVDTRLTAAGGRYTTPIDLEASRSQGFEVLREDLAFSNQNDAYFRWDIKFGFKLNSKNKKQSHQFYVDLQNVLNIENIFVERYNRLTNEINRVDQIGFFPDVGYRFQF